MTASRLDDRELDHRRRALERAQHALERVVARPPRESPPRIEIVMGRLVATIGMLELVGEHLGTLRDLSYNRTKAAGWRERVAGGDRDYALDNHGDPRARELYRQVVWEILDLLEDSTITAHDVVKFMKDGEQTHRRRSSVVVQPEEIIAALDAQRRRIERGESSAPTEVQPVVKSQTASELDVELRALRSATAKLRPERLTKSDRQRLTPLEVQAWDRAVPKPSQAPRSSDVRPGGGWRR